MKRNFRGLSVVAAFALCAAMFVPGTGGAAPSKSNHPHVTIGVSAILSGAYAFYGIDYERGVAVAANEINKSKIPGMPRITLDLQNDQGSATGSVEVAQKLISSKSVAAIGNIFSSQDNALMPVYQRAGMPFFGTGSDPSITAVNEDVWFASTWSDVQECPFDANTAYNVLGKHQVFIVGDGSTFATGLDNNFTTAFEKLGGTVLGSENIDPTQNDFSPILSKLKSSNPPLIYFSGFPQQAAELLTQGSALGIPSSSWLWASAMYDPSFISGASTLANGAIITGSGLPPALNPAAKTYLAAFKKAYPKAPFGAVDFMGYDTLNFIAYVIAHNQGKPITRSSLRKEMRASTGFTGVTGPFKYTSKGWRQKPDFALITVANGQFQLYKPAG